MQPIVHTQSSYGFRPGAQDFPLMVVITFSYHCNANCPHCPYTHSNIREKYHDNLFMSATIFQRVADEVGAHGGILRVSGGGEPMLHPQAVPLLSYAKAVGCRIGLITNGSAFTEKNSRQLLQAGVDMIEFSVDAADRQTYEKVRQNLKWARLVKNVKRMLALRDALGSSSKIIASGIAQKGVDIAQVEQFWRQEIGVDSFIRRKFLTWGVSTRLDDSMSADLEGFIDPQMTPCPYPFERLFVDARGNIMICVHDLAGNRPVGHISQQTIQAIWHGEALQAYRRKHLDLRGRETDLCAACPDWKYRTWGYSYYHVLQEVEQKS